jgi:predicted transport protein
MMSPVIRVSDQTYERLKRFAIPWETPDDTVEWLLDNGRFPDRTKSDTTKRQPRRAESEEAYRETMSEAGRAAYDQMRSRLAEVGDDVEVGVTPQYVKLMVKGSNFAEVQGRKKGLYILVHPNGHNLEPGEKAIEDSLDLKRVHASAGWTLNVGIYVDPETDMDAVIRALRKSYEAVKQRGR